MDFWNILCDYLEHNLNKQYSGMDEENKYECEWNDLKIFQS